MLLPLLAVALWWGPDVTACVAGVASLGAGIAAAWSPGAQPMTHLRGLRPGRPSVHRRGAGLGDRQSGRGRPGTTIGRNGRQAGAPLVAPKRETHIGWPPRPKNTESPCRTSMCPRRTNGTHAVTTSSPLGAPDGPGDAIRASELVRRHPDRRATGLDAELVLARLEPGALPPVHVLLDRLESAATAFPLMFSRTSGSWWVPAASPEPVRGDDRCRAAWVAPLQPLSLKHESPLRVMTPTSGEWLLLCAHHFAFDGLGMVELLRTLLTGEAAEGTDYMVQSSPRRCSRSTSSGDSSGRPTG